MSIAQKAYNKSATNKKGENILFGKKKKGEGKDKTATPDWQPKYKDPNKTKKSDPFDRNPKNDKQKVKKVSTDFKELGKEPADAPEAPNLKDVKEMENVTDGSVFGGSGQFLKAGSAGFRRKKSRGQSSKAFTQGPSKLSIGLNRKAGLNIMSS